MHLIHFQYQIKVHMFDEITSHYFIILLSISALDRNKWFHLEFQLPIKRTTSQKTPFSATLCWGQFEWWHSTIYTLYLYKAQGFDPLVILLMHSPLGIVHSRAITSSEWPHQFSTHFPSYTLPQAILWWLSHSALLDTWYIIPPKITRDIAQFSHTT